jgi:hypothetical protein
MSWRVICTNCGKVLSDERGRLYSAIADSSLEKA